MKKNIYIRKYLAILPFVSFLSFKSQAQLTLQSAIPIKSTTAGGNNDAGRSIAYDQQGNYYVTGGLNGVSDFDPNTAGVQGPSSILNNGQAFLAKYNANGAFQWYKMLPGGAGSYAGQVATTNDGVCVTHLHDDGSYKVTISKYDFTGTVVWSHILNMSTTTNRVNSLKTDGNGNIYIAGTFAGSNIDFDPGTGTAPLSSTGGTYASGYVAKYDGTGAYQWAFSIAGNTASDGSNYETGMSNFKLAISGNNLFVTGRFVGSNIDFDPSSVTNTLSMNSTTLAPIFVAKYDVSQAPSSSSFFKWVFQPEGAFTSLSSSYSARFSMPADIDVDGQGNIYTVGQYVLASGAADFNPGTGQTTAMTTGTTMKVYVASYNGALNPTTAGFYRWGFTRAGSASNVTTSTSILYNSNYIGAIAATASGDFYLSGAFSGSGVDLNPLGTPVTISGGSVDIYLAKYNTNGICQWGNSFSTGSDGVSNAISSLATGNGNIYATGQYKSSAGIDFDPGTGNTATTSFSTGSDVIVLKYSVCTPSSSTISATSCGSYTSPSGNNTWTTSGTYTDVVSNQAGCDSTITINLTITSANVGVTQNGNVLTASASGSTYQWVNCNNNYSVINGATNQSYAPTANGSYAVIVTQGSCSDTSQCFVISTLGVNELFEGQVEIAPNPAVSQVMVNTTINNPVLEVFNAQGQRLNVAISNVSVNEFILEVGSLSSGVYYILIQNQDGYGTYKFLKQ